MFYLVSNKFPFKLILKVDYVTGKAGNEKDKNKSMKNNNILHGAHVRTNLCYLICLWHLNRSKAVPIRTNFPCVRNISKLPSNISTIISHETYADTTEKYTFFLQNLYIFLFPL